MNSIQKNIPFVGLHAHSTFSVFDGFGFPSEHMDRAHAHGMDALALTDHGNMNGLSYQILHAQKMKAEGKNFKPIFGIEAYFIPSITDWREQYEEAKLDKKRAKTLEKEGSSGAIVNEEEAGKVDKKSLNRRRHLVLLAANQKGLENIYTMISKSYSDDNFYRYPRMDFDLLRQHSEGVVCLTACMSGVLAGAYWQSREDGPEAVLASMRELAAEFKDIFGDRFYGELQWNAIPEQHEINKFIIQICAELDIQLVSTADSHYPRRDAWKDRELYKRLGWLGKSAPAWDDGMPDSVEDMKYELYPKNGQEMYDAYQKYSSECGVEYDEQLIFDSLTTTHFIAHDVIEDFEPDVSIRLPDFVVPEGKTAEEALCDLCKEGLAAKGFAGNKEYEDRLDYEFDIIVKQGFAKYFLTMKAIADKANDMMLSGPGRGSAAGALLSYVLGITQVDPLRWGLLFERFMTAEQKGMPDIDFDVSEPMLLKEKLAGDWGEFSVVPITNWNTLQLRSLIKDVAKFYDIDFGEVNLVTSVMENEARTAAKKRAGVKAGIYALTFDDVMDFSPTLQGFLAKHPDIKTHVESLRGSVRSCSRHAGGCLVADNLNEHMPLIRSGGVWQTPWSEGQNVRHLEPLGFIKFDLLGLSTLKMVEGAIAHILKRHHNNPEPTYDDIRKYYDENLHPDVMNFNDSKVWDVFSGVKKAPGIFQFAETGMQGFCEQVAPTNLEELSAVTSIFRPGPLSAGVDEDYVKTKRGLKKPKYEHPILKEVLEKNYGFIIYQEDLAKIAHRMGKDITLTEGNKLRKLLTKQGTGAAGSEKAKIHDKFIVGCVEKGMAPTAAEKLWQKMEYFSGYGFNASHAYSYSIISYQCAHLFAYYAPEWVAAFLDKEPDSRKEKAIGKAKGLGFEITNLNVNTSGRVWEISEDGKALIPPLTSIKGLGDKAIDQVFVGRPYNNIEEFLFHPDVTYSKLNKKSVDVLVRSGTLNTLMDDRFTGAKHFWSAVAVDRPKRLKNLLENIAEYAPEGDFTEEEKIQSFIDLTGQFPIIRVMGEELLQKLKDKYLNPISEYDKALGGVVWCIPRKVVERKTKTGKVYWIVEVTDSNSVMAKIRVWGVDKQMGDTLKINKPYLIKPAYHSKWGFSTRGRVNKTWRLLEA